MLEMLLIKIVIIKKTYSKHVFSLDIHLTHDCSQRKKKNILTHGERCLRYSLQQDLESARLKKNLKPHHEGLTKKMKYRKHESPL